MQIGIGTVCRLASLRLADAARMFVDLHILDALRGFEMRCGATLFLISQL